MYKVAKVATLITLTLPQQFFIELCWSYDIYGITKIIIIHICIYTFLFGLSYCKYYPVIAGIKSLSFSISFSLSLSLSL